MSAPYVTFDLDQFAKNLRVAMPVRQAVLIDEPNGGEGLTARIGIKYEVDIYTDGTTTKAEIVDPEDDQPIGSGTARRRKGDTRNPEVGIALALARAFQDAARNAAQTAEELMS